MPGPRCERRSATRPTTPSRTNCWTSCWPSCAIARSAPSRASRPAAPSTCCTDPTAPRWRSSATTTSWRAPAGDEESEQRWREWELELAEGADRRPAGPAGQPAARRGRGAGRPRFEARAGPRAAEATTGRGRARAAGRSGAPRGGRAGGAAAGVGPRGAGRRVRLGAPDAGDHAQDPQPAAGVGGCVRHLRRRVGPRRAAAAGRRFWGWRATPRCSPSATSGRSTNCPTDLVRGPVRERLVEGAKRRYKSGLRRSLIAMRSQRYFRLLDALEGLVAAEPPPTAAGRRAGPADHRLGLQAGAQGGQGRGRRPPTPRTRRGAAPNPQGRQATSLHRGRDRRQARFPTAPRRSRRCSATIRTAWSAARI